MIFCAYNLNFLEILVGAFPCGLITVFDELYGSESLTQVYAIMIEYLSCLTSLTREKLVEICYDDACHFKKFGCISDFHAFGHPP